MKRPLTLTLIIFLCAFAAFAQKKSPRKKITTKTIAAKKAVEPATAVVIDERLAVLRNAPSLFARPLQRMRRGRSLTIFESKSADGVTFCRVAATRRVAGWVQLEALAAKNKRDDEERLVRLIQSSDGFEKIERAQIFLQHFPASPLRPAILLLFGDLLEEVALRLSSEASRRLSRGEMAASGAPLHSFFLNYASLDRYRRLGIVFWFNPAARRLHYNGASWREIVEKFPQMSEAAEAQKRLDALKEKIEAGKEELRSRN